MKLFCKKCEEIFPFSTGDAPVVNCPKCNAEFSRPESELASGVVVGDFVIEQSISKGGMGEVFLARQISLDRPVALKILQKEFTNDPEYVESLFREARAAAKISHPNIVQAYAVGQDDGVCFFAMELVRGDTLKNILRKEGALPAVKAAKIICDIANALDVAWREQKLVHQDIKPDNIMVDVNGFSKLADLGLAKTGNKEKEESNADDSDEVMGTPQYISPEQLTGVPTDVRSDIYSLGATFYHIVTGKLPYRAADLEELARMHDAGNLTPPKEVKEDLPEELNKIIVKMMARNIEQRYQEPAELIKDLSAFINHGTKITPKLNLPGNAAKKISMPSNAAEHGVPAVPKTVVPAVPKPVVPAVPKPVVPAVPKPVVPAVPPASGAEKDVPPEESKKSFKINKKIVTIVVFIAIGIIVLVAAAGGTMIYLEKNGKIPAIVTPLLGIKVEEENAVIPENANSAQEVAVEPENKVEETIVTAESTLELFEVAGRKEYMVPVTELIKWQQENQDNHSEFFRKFEAVWEKMCYPVTSVESASLTKIKAVFSPVDELQRCREIRENLRQEHISRVNEAEAEFAELKRKEAEALAEQKIRQQEMEREKLENAKLQKETELQNQKRRGDLLREGSQLLGSCLVAMRDAAITGENSTFNEALEKAKTFVNSVAVFTPEEVAVINNFKMIIRSLPAEKSKLEKIFKGIAGISRKHNIRIMHNRRTVPLVGIKSGELIFSGRNQRQESYAYSNADEQTRALLFYGLEQQLKLKNCEFYSDLFHRKRPADAKVPAGFWKKVWPVVKNKF